MKGSNGTFHFFSKTGVIAGAVIAVGTIVSWLSGKVWVLTVDPVVSEWHSSLMEERHARVLADSLLFNRIQLHEAAGHAPRKGE